MTKVLFELSRASSSNHAEAYLEGVAYALEMLKSSLEDKTRDTELGLYFMENCAHKAKQMVSDMSDV